MNTSSRPIRLVYCDDNGKFQMDEAAASILKHIKEPLGVVSVCGPSRQGKSYILNLLSGSGFKVASSDESSTKGLWVWSSPIRRSAEDGSEYSLLLIDSEGSLHGGEMYFYLAVHLSSMLIYNEMGGIDGSALGRLSLVTKLADKKHDPAASNKLGQVSPPKLVWLLRDCYVNMVDDQDNKRISPGEYLERALRPRPEAAASVFLDQIRESIRALFPKRECFSLVRPVTEEDDLMQLDKISMDKLRPEFRTGLNELKGFVFKSTNPKYVQGMVMTGPIFVDLTKALLDAFNNGLVPPITSLWQTAALPAPDPKPKRKQVFGGTNTVGPQKKHKAT